MDIEKLKSDIKSFINSHQILNIPCCEDSTDSFDAYNNIDCMYKKDNIESEDITIFNEYLNNKTREDLALELGVDYEKLDSLFRYRSVPSKGLAIAISLILNLKIDELELVLARLRYSLLNNDSDKICKYFFINDIRDINLLNDVLVSFGSMYLYSKKKLR